LEKNTLTERIYLRLPKPLNEMTEEEIRMFAEETYEQIVCALGDKKNTETNQTNSD